MKETQQNKWTDGDMVLWQDLQALRPFGFGNPEPVFATRKVKVLDVRTVGAEKKHLKLKVAGSGDGNPPRYLGSSYDCIAFGFGPLAKDLVPGSEIDIAYTIDLNIWNGVQSLQLKIKDIRY